MTAIDMDTFDDERLPAPQYMMLQALMARHRCGQKTWSFHRKMLKAAQALAELGLVRYWVGGDNRVGAALTSLGERRLLNGSPTPQDRKIKGLEEKIKIWENIALDELANRLAPLLEERIAARTTEVKE